MSVLCIYIPNMLLKLACQARPDLMGKPLVILDEDERITSLSPEAVTAGITSSMTPQRAQLKCPEVYFQDANLPAFTQAQATLLEALTDWELPTEESAWGLAYVDLHLVTKERDEVKKLVTEMGSRLRASLGILIQPHIGWDSGKFTAKAAAVRTQPGTMKLIDATREVPFLQPLPVALLPLPTKDLRWLNRLGIRTLGQYGALPHHQIQTALGKQGVLTQQWALGNDSRPVMDTVSRRCEPIRVDFDYHNNLLTDVVQSIMDAIAHTLANAAATRNGLRQMRVNLHFVEDIRAVTLIWVDPTSQPERIAAHLTNRLQSLVWPGPICQVVIIDMQLAELSSPTQLGLFDEVDITDKNAHAWLAGIRERYGEVRYQGALKDINHAIAGCRTSLQTIA